MNTIPWWRTEFGVSEAANVTAAIRDRCISQGRITREFEERLAERLGVPYVVCTTSGTTALTMALLACGVGAGDTVVIPDKTWIATAHAVMMTGARPILVDTCADLPLISHGEVWARLDMATRAVVPVNLNGRDCGAGSLWYGFPNEDIFVVEDSCQSFPRSPREDVACYSLSTAKIIATGQGGFCATRNEALYRELLALRTHDVPDAMIPAVLEWRRFGYNFRFTDIQAAIGLAQLERLDARLERLREINSLYMTGLPENLRPLRHTGLEIPLYNEIVLPDLASQEHLRADLLAQSIEARPFYPLLHTAAYLNAEGEFPNAEAFAHGLTLPSGPCQTDADIKRVCQAVSRYAETPLAAA